MSSKIILKKSSVAARVPVVGDLEYGELALNYQDGTLYYKKANNTIGSIAGSGAGNVTKVVRYNITGPLLVSTGTLRWYPESSITLTGVYFSLGSPGTSTVTMDVKVDQLSVLSTLPTASAGQYKSIVVQVPSSMGGNSANASLVITDYITVDVVNPGGAVNAILYITYF